MSNFKKMVEARIDKTGESWSTAARNVRARVETVPFQSAALRVPPPTDLGSLLAELRAVGTFAILTGRVPATGGSASLAVAQEQSLRLLNNPLWYAESGGVQKTITREQHEQLVRDGAADDTKIQIIRSFHNEHGTTFSEHCRRCHKWIWCGEQEVEGRCVCGATYRIVFDLPKVEHWSQRQGWLCMDCGKESRMREWVDAREPWRAVNERQMQCEACHQKHPARSAPGRDEDRQFEIVVTEPDGRHVHRGPATRAQSWHLHNCGYSVTGDGWAVTSSEMNPMLLGGRTRAFEQGHQHLLVASERKGNPFLLGTASASTLEGLGEPGYKMLASFKQPVGMHIERYVGGEWKVELTYYFAD